MIGEFKGTPDFTIKAARKNESLNQNPEASGFCLDS
jgi:hypothetical protein